MKVQRVTAMDVVLSAVASDLFGRLVSFLITKCQEPASVDDGARLQRARVVVEEAEGRQVTNLAMLLQLRQLRREMCRAAYALRVRAAAAASRRRRLPLLLNLSDSLGGGACGDGMVVESLEAALRGAKELVVLLGGCPRLTRRPYSAYLFMERCMFGRQMEMEQIVDFLLRPACSSAGEPNPGVLPVVGLPEIFKGIHPFGLFANVSLLAAWLRADVTLRSWRRIARALGETGRLQLGGARGGRGHCREKGDLYICSPFVDAPHCLFYGRRKLPTSFTRGRGGDDEPLPTVTMQDLLTGRVLPSVDTPRFDVLVWKSRIPPYCSYVRTCEMDGAQKAAAAASCRKRPERSWPDGILEHDEWLKKKKKTTIDES